LFLWATQKWGHSGSSDRCGTERVYMECTLCGYFYNENGVPRHVIGFPQALLVLSLPSARASGTGSQSCSERLECIFPSQSVVQSQLLHGGKWLQKLPLPFSSTHTICDSNTSLKKVKNWWQKLRRWVAVDP
jgi:hypothetical protein